MHTAIRPEKLNLAGLPRGSEWGLKFLIIPWSPVSRLLPLWVRPEWSSPDHPSQVDQVRMSFWLLWWA